MSEAPEPARRFYKQAQAQDGGGAFTVVLDARRLKTPAGAAFRVPPRALAEGCAAEWQAQGDHIVPARMPITQLAFAAIDWTAPNRAGRIDYVASYGETDLCCHRADTPETLVARQAATWDPLVAWGARALGVTLPIV